MGRNDFWGETSQGEMSRGETSLGEKRLSSDADVIFEKLGSTMRLHVEFGKLNIQPYSNGYETKSDSIGHWVSCSISCEIWNLKSFGGKYLSVIQYYILLSLLNK